MSLSIQESGTPGAPTIVFLHGAATSGWMWQGQIDALQDFHCLNVDLPGNGRSNHIPWVSMHDTANQVADIIKTRATNGKAFVVGLSLGAYVSLFLMAQHPERVERAVISGVTAIPLPNPFLMRLQLYGMSLLMKVPWFIRMQARMLQLPPEAMPYYQESMRAMSRTALLKIFEELLDFRLPPALAQVTVPTLVAAGGAEVPLILQSIEVITRTMPRAEGRIAPGLHHGWNGENPALFTAMVRAWLTDTPLPAELALPHTSSGVTQPVLAL